MQVSPPPSRPSISGPLHTPPPEALAQASLRRATANLGASFRWGAAGAISAPFVALMPPLWLLPAYCGLRSAKLLGRGVYDVGCATVPLLQDAEVCAPARLMRLMRHAKALYEAGLWAQTASLLAPPLAELRQLERDTHTDKLANTWMHLTRLYNAAMRAYFASLPQANAHRARLAAALCNADDAGFMKLFNALTPADQRMAAYMTADGEAAPQLVELAITYDCPQALWALRDSLQQPEAMFGPWICHLTEQTEHIALGVRALQEQLPKLAHSMVLAGTMSAREFLRAFAQYADGDHPVVREAAHSLVRAQLISAIACLAAYPDSQLMRQFVQTKQVDIADIGTLGRGQGRLRSALLHTLAETEAGAQRLCEAHLLTQQEAQLLVRNGMLTPQLATRHCPVGLRQAQTWYRDGRISLADYIPFTAESYTPRLPLSAEQVAFAQGFHAPSAEPAAVAERLQALWEALRPVHMPGGTRRSFLLRMSAVALAGPPPATAAAAASKPTQTTWCVVCLEPCDAERPAQISAHCQHEASVCADCIKQEALINHSARCVVPNCHAVLSPNDLLAACVPPPAIFAICRAMVQTRLAAVPNWRTCWTPDCFGGAQVPRGTEQAYCCPACTRTVTLASRILDQQKDIEYAKRLIAHVGDLSSMTNAVRECYWCGAGTEHGEACAHMHCSKCDLEWDFNRGPCAGRNAGARYALAQAYVPRAGLLLDAGLYEGLEAGSHNHTGESVAQHVRERAKALGLL